MLECWTKRRGGTAGQVPQAALKGATADSGTAATTVLAISASPVCRQGAEAGARSCPTSGAISEGPYFLTVIREVGDRHLDRGPMGLASRRRVGGMEPPSPDFGEAGMGPSGWPRSLGWV